jgi:hypothetical protein
MHAAHTVGLDDLPLNASRPASAEVRRLAAIVFTLLMVNGIGSDRDRR